MDTAQKSPTVLSFCTGYGGIERGLELAGLKPRILAHVEIEAFAIANLVDKMETGLLAPAPIWTNLKTFPVEPFRGRVDILTGGYPCQPFSAAGKRLGSEDPRHLWPYIRSSIDAIRPEWCFFENVEGHISMGLSDVIEDLGRLGYRSTFGIFSAAEVGAPHRRKRVFILAHSNSGRFSVSDFRLQQQGGAEVIGTGKNELADPGRVTKGSKSAGFGGRGENPSETAGIGSNEGDGFTDSGENVADPDDARQHTNEGQPRPPEERDDIGGRGEEKGIVANPNGEGLERRRRSNTQGPEGQQQTADGGFLRWPARPGQPQHDWEEPRTTAKPQLGGTTNGPSNRVDRLRLLGNGVVPMTAAKAFLTLSQEFK